MTTNDWNGFVERFRARIEHAARELSRLTDGEASRRPAPGKWSRKEIVGHLVDSASNNHQRFVRARFQTEFVFPGYDQDAWVAAQHWNEADWRELVELWRAFNLQLARLMLATPPVIRDRAHERHNLDQIAFKELPAGTPATLGWFMADYVDHLEHHLRQAALQTSA